MQAGCTEAVSVYGKCSDDDGDESTKESGTQHGWGSGIVEAATTGWAYAPWKYPNPSAAQKEKELQVRVVIWLF